MRRSKPIILVLSLAMPAFGGACDCKQSTQSTTRTTSVVDDSGPLVVLMGDFRQTPDDEHFDALLVRARGSDDPMLSALLGYEEVSKRMRPVHVPYDAAIIEQLGTRPAKDFRLVAQVMLIHENRWRRWTMAKVLGDYAPGAYNAELRRLLDDPYDFVRDYAREAIK